MKANSKEVYSTQFDPLEKRMNYTNTDDNSITEIKSREIPVDPCDKLVVLHWIATLLEESSLGNVPKQPVSPCFGAETKKRSIRARDPFSNWGTRSLSLVNCNPVMVNCPNIYVSVNAAVSDNSDFLSSEQAKSQSSNKGSETDRKIEAKKVIKCMHCSAQETPQWRAGPTDSKTLCNACGLRYRHGKLVPEYRPRAATSTFPGDGKCVHCGTQETPQWRSGPMDPRTLCNACGLRYRHGKLVPEYRPKPATPTFSVHAKCVHCGTQESPQWRSGPMGPSTLCDTCGVRYRNGKLPPDYRPELVKCTHCGTQKISRRRCNACGLRHRCGRRVPEDRPSSSSIFSVYKHYEAKGQKEFTSQASEGKQTSSGSEALENCPNSSLLANTAECNGSDYSVSKQTKSDSIKGIMRKGQHAMNARKCVDCGTQRTVDSVTACNTCGVKYRSGRNSPKYSPVASPKVSADKDSHSDKLVLERKAQRELAYQGKQTNIASQLQDSCAEPQQNGLGNQPKSKPVNSDPFRKIRKTSKGIMRKVQVRKCMHCSIKKTPQWRDGPMGPKTLCNACGVRYRAGKLLPEYRPAASPTFSANKHSNSHKKVLDIRSQK